MNEQVVLLPLGGKPIRLSARCFTAEGESGYLPGTTWTAGVAVSLDTTTGASVVVTPVSVGTARIRAEHVTERIEIRQEAFKQLWYEGARPPHWESERRAQPDVYREGYRPVAVTVPTTRYDDIVIVVYDPAEGPPRLEALRIEVEES